MLALGLLGRFDEAKHAVHRLLELLPGFTFAGYLNVSPFKGPVLRKRFDDIYRAAGALT